MKNEIHEMNCRVELLNSIREFKKLGCTDYEILDMANVMLDSMKPINKDKSDNTFQSKIRKEVFFDSKKDVQFFDSLIELSPNSDTSKIINVMRVVFKLLDIDSSYSL